MRLIWTAVPYQHQYPRRTHPFSGMQPEVCTFQSCRQTHRMFFLAGQGRRPLSGPSNRNNKRRLAGFQCKKRKVFVGRTSVASAQRDRMLRVDRCCPHLEIGRIRRGAIGRVKPTGDLIAEQRPASQIHRLHILYDRRIRCPGLLKVDDPLMRRIVCEANAHALHPQPGVGVVPDKRVLRAQGVQIGCVMFPSPALQECITVSAVIDEGERILRACAGRDP